MAISEFKSRFRIGDFVEFHSSTYGSGHGTIDTIILHHDVTISYILDIHPGGTFGGPSPNLYGGFLPLDLILVSREDSPRKDQGLDSNTCMSLPFCFHNVVRFVSTLNGAGEGHIIEISIDCTDTVSYSIQALDENHFYGIMADEMSLLGESNQSLNTIIINYI